MTGTESAPQQSSFAVEQDTTNAPPDDPLAPAIEFIARFGIAGRLLTTHVPDEHGLCRGCTSPGYGTPHLPWPCLLRTLATDPEADG